MPFKKSARRVRRAPQEDESPAVEPELIRFVTPQALEKFNSCIQGRSLLMEKGFVSKQGNIEGYSNVIRDVIARHGWTTFGLQQPEAWVNVVKEFYANYDPATPDEVFVRGMQISLTSVAINSIYKLQEVENDFEELVAGLDVDQLDEMLHVVCEESAEWTKASRGSMVVPRRLLKPGARVWFHFLKSRLMPSTHDHVIHKERIVLLYCILEGEQFNVGQLIKQQIGVCARRSTGKLWFPSLITQLCKAQGMVIENQESIEPPSAPITHFTIGRFLQEDHQSPGAERTDVPPSQSHQAQSQSFQYPSSSLTEQRLSQIEIVQYDLVEQQRLLAEEQRIFWRYQYERDLAIQKNLRANSKKFFSFPKFPESLLSVGDEEEEIATAGPSSGPTEEGHQQSASPTAPEGDDPNAVQDESPVQPSRGRDKQLSKQKQTLARRPVLRSDKNWSWNIK